VTSTDRKSGRVDIGARDGLLPGMILHYQGADGFTSYRVVRVDDASAEVETEYSHDPLLDGPVSTLLFDASVRPGD
jgi:hypothetical protein